MATVSLLQLRNLCRKECGMSGSSAGNTQPNLAVDDDTFNAFINSSLGEFNDLLISKDVHFFLTSSQQTVAAGASSITIPSDCKVVKGVDYLNDTTNVDNRIRLETFRFDERNRGNSYLFPYANGGWVRYCVYNSTIELRPAANAPGNYLVWYYAQQPDLVNDTDTVDQTRWWPEYVVVDVSIKVKDSRREDVSVLMARKQQLKDRIEMMAADRDYGSAQFWGPPRGPRGWGWGGMGGGPTPY